MSTKMKEVSPSRQSASKVIFAAFKIIKEAGGQLEIKTITEKIPEKIILTEWEKEVFEKSGYIRWQSILHFYSIDCQKAGYLQKNKGIWYLTQDGEKAMKLGELGLLNAASEAYKLWNSNKGESKVDNQSKEEIAHVDEAINQVVNLSILEEKAISGIKDAIMVKTPYEFQNLVAALLRAMGFYTPFVAPKGKDGGIDVLAYKDPLGAETPRMKVQVKHWKDKTNVSVTEVRSLTGLLSNEGDVGLIVTSGVFTNEAIKDARSNHKHIRLLDINEFISLWQQYYIKMSDDDKNLLPLKSIYFLGVNE